MVSPAMAGLAAVSSPPVALAQQVEPVPSDVKLSVALELTLDAETVAYLEEPYRPKPVAGHE